MYAKSYNLTFGKKRNVWICWNNLNENKIKVI